MLIISDVLAGVHGSRYVTTHGLSLNCNTDLSWYEHIIPCGIEDLGVTSISTELHQNVSVEKVLNVFCQSFSNTFSCDLDNIEEGELMYYCAKVPV